MDSDALYWDPYDVITELLTTEFEDENGESSSVRGWERLPLLVG